MKANKVLAGRVCPGCSVPIELADDVWNCPRCRNTMHQNCHQTAGGCRSDICAPQLTAPAVAPQVAPGPEQKMKECRACGEKILAKASICKYCGESQTLNNRFREAQEKRRAATEDNLSGLEIAFGLLCGGIACIMAVVWLIQGKKKGWKLLLLSIVSQMIFGVIRATVKRH